MKKKRILSILLAISLCVGLLSVNLAFAEEESIGVLETEEANDAGMAEQNEEEGNLAEVEESASLPEEENLQQDPSGTSTMSLHSAKWVNGSNAFTISEEGTRIDMVPASNQNNYASVQVDFSFGGYEDLPAGTIEIRVPGHVFFGRDGSPVDTVGIPVVQAPEASGDTGFHYTIDEETGEIVLTNFQTISASYKFTGVFRYEYDSLDVEDLYSNENDAYQVNFKVSLADGTTLEEQSEELIVTVDTDFPTPKGTKGGSKYETWQSSWGTAPENAEDYFFAVWRVSTELYSWTTSTQPFEIVFEEQPEQGEVLAWQYVINSTVYNAIPGTLAELNQMTLDRSFHSRSGRLNGLYVIVGYKRSDYATEGTVLRNTVHVEYRGDNDQVKEVDLSGSFTYRPVNMEYAGDLYETRKSLEQRNGTDSAINRLENGQDTDPQTLVFGAHISARGWGLTNNGTDPYTVILEDKYLYDYETHEQLAPEDYSYTGFNIYSTNVSDMYLDPDRGMQGRYRAKNDIKPVEVYIRTLDNNEFHKYGEVTHDFSKDNYAFIFTDINGVETRSEQKYYETDTRFSYISLPEGTYDISLRYTDIAYYVSLGLRLQTQFHPTEHMKALIGEKTSFQIGNMNNAFVKNVNGEITSPASTNRYWPAWAPILSAAEYGQNVMHYTANGTINKIIATSTASKSATVIDATEEDKALSRQRVQYTLVQRQTAGVGNYSREEALELGLFPEQRDGYFYDLLPAGTYIDESTMVARAAQSGNSSQSISSPDFAYEIEYVDNWKDSGRTMMIVHVTAPEDWDNVIYSRSSSSSSIYSGMTISFTLIDTWSNIQDYGTYLDNYAAYYSNDGNLADGYADDGNGYNFTNDARNWFTDLDEDGNIDDSKKNVLYMQNGVSVSPVMAMELGFSKAVKTPNDRQYSLETETVGDGEYTYRLRFANGETSKASNLIIYDNLEVAGSDGTRWKGTFQSVNTSHVEQKGIDVKVYYSTYPNLGNFSTQPEYADLTNETYWSLEEPEDLSTVTAVAFDLRNKKDQTPYVFSENETALCFITMKAPQDVSPYLDDPDTEEDETVYAKNSAYLHSTSNPNLGGEPTTATEECAPTSVKLREKDIEIHKSSDPASGTKEAPTEMTAESALQYQIDLKNTDETETISSIVMEDVIPTHLTIDEANIKVYFGADAESAQQVDEQDRITLELDGQKITFTIDELAVGEEVHFLIPTTVSLTARVDGTTMENTARITSFDGVSKEIESETTYHEVKPVQISFTAVKEWDDGENQYGVRPDNVTVQLYVGAGSDKKPVAGKTAVLSEENQWTAIFPNITRYDEDGETELVYSVEEEVPAGYSPSYGDVEKNAQIITNTRKQVELNEAGFRILKVQAGDASVVIPDVEFTLTDADGEETVQTTDENGIAEFSFTPEGTETISYTLRESKTAEGYIASENNWTVTLTRRDTPVVSLNEETDQFEVLWTWDVAITLNEEVCESFADGTLNVENTLIPPEPDEPDEPKKPEETKKTTDPKAVTSTSSKTMDSNPILPFFFLLASSLVVVVFYLKRRKI